MWYIYFQSSSSPTGAEADIGGHISAKLSSTIAPPPTVSEQPTQVVGSTDDKMSLTHGGTKASDVSLTEIYTPLFNLTTCFPSQYGTE